MIRIFVYGTLRVGDSRSSMLGHGNTKFIDNIKTASLYTLLDLGSFPALLTSGDTSIVGELWEVDEYTKKYLDLVEGVPMLYQDEEIELEDGTTAIAYTFDFNRGYPIIESGDWFNK